MHLVAHAGHPEIVSIHAEGQMGDLGDFDTVAEDEQLLLRVDVKHFDPSAFS